MKKLIALALIVCACPVWAQEKDTTNLYDLSLEELLNVPIVSASRKEETLFNAPLSSYTLTQAEIIRAGATSIMEALRLVPGVIVREQANGVYDIHIRGFDNITGYSETFTKSNLLTLVMIDNRPVFNHNLGGTFWESLPVDIADVERIEVVRGPSAPLFGPNAVTGVINIITRRSKKDQTMANAHVTYGSPTTLLANALVGKSFTEKLAAQVSFNYTDRKRQDDQFYNSTTGTYMNGTDLFGSSYKQYYPTADQSVKKWGLNAAFTYTPSEKTKVDIAAGTQDSESLKAMLGSHNTLLNTASSRSSYVNVLAQASNFTLRSSYTGGTDNLSYASIPNSYDYHVMESNLEYAWNISERIQVVPAVSYQDVRFNDKQYYKDIQHDLGVGIGYLNGTEKQLTTLSGSVRADIRATDAWRVLAAIRADKFSAPDDVYVAYELATTYSINEKNLIRAAFTRSNSGSFMGYNNLLVAEPDGSVTRGNKNLNILTITMAEVGYRAQFSDKLQLDIDVFHQRLENPTVLSLKGLAPNVVEFTNLPTTATQTGATLGLNVVAGTALQVKPFVTVQSTDVNKLPSSFLDPALATLIGSPVTYTNRKHKNTPAVYGGLYANYRPATRLTTNISAYYLGNQTQYMGLNNGTVKRDVSIDGKLLLNVRISYTVVNNLSVFISGRNLLNQRKAEFLGADRTGASWLTGLSFSLN